MSYTKLPLATANQPIYRRQKLAHFLHSQTAMHEQTVN